MLVPYSLKRYPHTDQLRSGCDSLVLQLHLAQSLAAMSAEQGLSADLEHIAQESIQRHVDTIIAVTRQVWESQVDKAKEHSEAKAKYMELARQHEESLQACLRVAQDHEAKARNILIGQLGAEKILPLWEAAGDFAPPGFRQAFQDRVLPPPPDRPVPSRQQAETPESSGLSSLEPEAGPGVGASSGIQHRVKVIIVVISYYFLR